MRFITILILLFITVFSFSKNSTIPEVGSKAPDFTLKTIDGNNVHLGEILQNQQVVLVVLRVGRDTNVRYVPGR